MRPRARHPGTTAVIAVTLLTATTGQSVPQERSDLVSRPIGLNQRGSTGPGEVFWSRIYVERREVRAAVARAMRSASEWLQAPRCQTLVTEFSDRRGRALTERLAELRMTLPEYLEALIVQDGTRHARCGDDGVLAFTVVGSRVIHVCGDTFVRAAQRDREEVAAVLVHELLHSLGLGENPPTPRHITYRVKQLCW